MRKVSLIEKIGYNIYHDHEGLEDIQKHALRKQKPMQKKEIENEDQYPKAENVRTSEPMSDDPVDGVNSANFIEPTPEV